MYASGNWVSIGSGNGLAPVWRQAIAWTNADLLSIGPLGTNFSEILMLILTFSFKKKQLKWQPFWCRGDELMADHHLSLGPRASADIRLTLQNPVLYFVLCQNYHWFHKFLKNKSHKKILRKRVKLSPFAKISTRLNFKSFSRWRCGSNFKSVISEHMLQI